MRTTSALALVALAAACAGPVEPPPGPVGRWVAESLHVRTSFDTGNELLPLGGSLTMTLGEGGVLSGRLVVPAGFAPPGIPSITDDLSGTWEPTRDGFRVFPPAMTLLTAIEFTVSGDTATTYVVVQGFPLDPFGYRIRLVRQAPLGRTPGSRGP